MTSHPYYPADGLSPDAFVARKRLLDLPGSRVVTPEGKTWNPAAIWNGGQGGPPQGSTIEVVEPTPEPEAPTHQHEAQELPKSGTGWATCDCGATLRMEDGKPVGEWHACELCTHPYGLPAPEVSRETSEPTEPPVVDLRALPWALADSELRRQDHEQMPEGIGEIVYRVPKSPKQIAHERAHAEAARKHAEPLAPNAQNEVYLAELATLGHALREIIESPSLEPHEKPALEAPVRYAPVSLLERTPPLTTAQLRTAARDAEQAKRYAEAAELYELAAERYPGDASWISSALQRDDIAGLRRMAALCRRMGAIEAAGEPDAPPIWEAFEREAPGTVDRVCAGQVDAAPGPRGFLHPDLLPEPTYPNATTPPEAACDIAEEEEPSSPLMDRLVDEPRYRISRLEAAASRFHDAGAFLRRLSVVLVLLGLLAPALVHAAPAKPVHRRPACEEVKPGVWARPTKHGWSTTPCETEITFRETSRVRVLTIHKATPTACEIWLPAGYLAADARLAQRLETAEQMCIDAQHAAAERGR